MCVTRLPGVEEGPRARLKCEATNQTTSPKTSCSGKRAARHWQFQRADLILPSRQNPHAVKVDFASCSPQTSVELPRRPRVPRPPLWGRGSWPRAQGRRGRDSWAAQGPSGKKGTLGRSLHRAPGGPRPPSQTSTPCPPVPGEWSDQGQEGSLGPRGAGNLATPSVAWAATLSQPQPEELLESAGRKAGVGWGQGGARS